MRESKIGQGVKTNEGNQIAETNQERDLKVEKIAQIENEITGRRKWIDQKIEIGNEKKDRIVETGKGMKPIAETRKGVDPIAETGKGTDPIAETGKGTDRIAEIGKGTDLLAEKEGEKDPLVETGRKKIVGGIGIKLVN